MEAQGILAITTSCGFNAVFQRELADSVSVPVLQLNAKNRSTELD